MSNITSQNNIRFNIDTLSTQSFGVLATDKNAVNLSRASRVTAVNVTGTQPSGCTRHFAFCVNNQWGRLTSSGTFQAFATQSTTYDNISANGNTPADLAALTNIPALAGKSFGVAFALSSNDPVNLGVPSAAMSFTAVTDSQVLTTEETSPVFALGTDSQIISLNAETESYSGGSVQVLAQITRPDGSLSDWASLDYFTGQKASRVQFKGTYRAQTVGTSSAHIKNASVLYSDGKSILSGSSDGELITITQDWYMPVKSCRLTVKHAPLETAEMSAFIALRKSPVQVKNETLGTGSGAKKIYQLKYTDGLKYDSLKLYFDNVQVFSDYEFNCEIGRITCEAPEGVIVSCSYEYGWDEEVWEHMALSSRLSFDGYDQSEYRYTKPESDDENKSVCALKMVMNINSGHIDAERLGIANGRTQSFRLARRIKDGRVTLTANGVNIPAKNWSLLEDPQHVAVTATYGQTIRANYDWISETPAVYEFYAVYAE